MISTQEKTKTTNIIMKTNDDPISDGLYESLELEGAGSGQISSIKSTGSGRRNPVIVMLLVFLCLMSVAILASIILVYTRQTTWSTEQCPQVCAELPHSSQPEAATKSSMSSDASEAANIDVQSNVEDSKIQCDSSAGKDAEDTEKRTFKEASTDKLQLQCNQLQLIQRITKYGCITLAKFFNDSNAINYDNINSECSIQQCTQTNNIPTKAGLSTNMSILFEASFYPKTCTDRILVSTSANMYSDCQHIGTYIETYEVCKQRLCSGDYHTANFISNYCNIKQCSTSDAKISQYPTNQKILYKIPQY